MMNWQQKFIEYITENYPVGNGDMLTELQENMHVREDFISLHNLPEDIELF